MRNKTRPTWLDNWISIGVLVIYWLKQCAIRLRGHSYKADFVEPTICLKGAHLIHYATIFPLK